MSNGLIPWSSLTNRFSKFLDHKTDIREYATRRSVFIARFYKLRSFTVIDICCNSLLTMPNRRYAFDDAANYNISDIDDIIEPLNWPLYARVVCLTTVLYNCKSLIAKRLSVFQVDLCKSLQCLSIKPPTRRRFPNDDNYRTDIYEYHIVADEEYVLFCIVVIINCYLDKIIIMSK